MHIDLGERDHLENKGIDRIIKIRMDLTKVEWKGAGWIHLARAEDR